MLFAPFVLELWFSVFSLAAVAQRGQAALSSGMSNTDIFHILSMQKYTQYLRMILQYLRYNVNFCCISF